MLHFTEEQIRPLLTYESLIPAMERALIRFSAGEIRQPVRTILPVPEYDGLWGLMPAIDGEVMGIKLVMVYEKNNALGLPTHQAVIQLISAKTGEPIASLDGRLITEMRTAAVSAVATRLLAKPDARVLTVLGTGVQARAHIRALRLVRRFNEIRIWGRNPLHAQQAADELAVHPVLDLEQAVRGADVVVSAATVSEPLVDGRWLQPDTYVNAVAAVGPARRELDDAAMDATIVVESREAAMRESGDILGSGASVYAELGELLAGKAILPTGRRIVYKSLGIAAEDVAAAQLVLERHRSA